MTNPLKALYPVTLHEALSDAKRSLEEIKPLVHPDLANKKNSHRESPLKLACGNHGPDVIECIIDIGANINESMGVYQYTALQVAAGAGFLDLVRRLLHDRAHIDAQALDGRTALFEAIKNHHKETAKVLIAAKAKLHLYDEHGWTPLHVSVAEGDTELTEILLNLLSNSKELLNAKTRAGLTPLFLACEKGTLKTIQLLLDAGADTSIANGPNEETALHLLVRKNNIPALKLLLEKKPPIDPRTRLGMTPLYLASLHDYVDAAEKLVAAGADANAVCGPEGETPLFPAIRSKRQALFNALFSSRTRVNLQNTSKATPLEVACESDNYEAAEALIGAKAEVRGQALQAAVRCARTHLLALLLKHFSHLPREAPILLYLACMRGDPEILKILLDAGLDVNTKCGINGVIQTPLHWAAMKGNVALIQLLLQRRAKVTKIKEKTPFDLAQQNGHTEAARVLSLQN